MQQFNIHKNFQIEGISITDAQSLIEYIKPISIESADFLKNWFDENLFIEVNTSGSTGIPKKIRLKKQQLYNSAIATGVYFNLPENTSALLCLSSSYIAGKMMWVRALILGWHLDIVAVDSNPLANNKKTYDFSAMVPLQVANSLEQLFRIKKIIIGGGVVSDELQEKLQNISTDAFATYGMTETVTHIAVKKINNFLGKSTHYYELLPSIKIAIDTRGCLVIDAPLLADELVVTNDLVTLISENKFEWLGRFDSVINSGGIKLIPEKIEKKIAEVIAGPFFIAAKEHSLLGEKVILIVEGKHPLITEKKDILLFLQGAKLAPYELPKEIYFVKEFLLTETGKIRRSAIVKALD